MSQPNFYRSHDASRFYRLRRRNTQPNAMRWVKTESSKPQKPRVIRIAFARPWVVAAIIVAVLTIRLPKTGALSKKVRIDRIVVNKSARELVFRNGEKFKTYRVALG